MGKKTVFDEDRTASFGTKIVWLSRIKESFTISKRDRWKIRVQLQQKLNEIRIIRNDFAHNFAQNKKIESENVKNRVIMLYDFEEGETVPKLFKMQEIMDMINDGWVLEQLNQIELVTKKLEKIEIYFYNIKHRISK